MTDDEIDTSDIPPLTKEFFERAHWREPIPEDVEIIIDVTIPVDAEVLSWFRARGDDWERRMNDALREYVKMHGDTEDHRASA
jgi:uncharacterized protein (DUF4415 family)